MDVTREAEIVMHYVLGRKLDPPLRPEEEDVARKLKAEIEARMKSNLRIGQSVRRRRFLMIAGDVLILAGILAWGTSSWPLASPEFEFLSLSGGETLKAIATFLLIAVICLLAMACHRLYSWRSPVKRADLPNRLLSSFGYALVMLAVFEFLVPGSMYLPGLDSLTWPLLLLLTLGFGAIYAWRGVFERFSGSDTGKPGPTSLQQEAVRCSPADPGLQ